MTEITYQLTEIEQVSEKIIPLLQHKVVLLQGGMGMGKTTLTKALVKALGVTDTVNSPTFNLVNEYINKKGKIFHFDFYRIKNEMEALDFGVEDYIYSGNWCFMEWAEKITPLLPEKYSVISISVIDENTRKITINN